MIELGKKYRDNISGFEGVATARFEYLTGCIRYCLESGGKDGKPEEWIFDEQRLEEVEAPPVKTKSAKRGGSRPTPPRTGSH